MTLEQQVRYCKTSDGVDIAYTTYGEGPPIVLAPNILVGHLQLELNSPQSRAFYERLSRRLQVIRYDPRGTGMSQRDVCDFSIEAGERDLLAVVDRLGLERFAVYNHVVAGEAPLAFVARHQDRVTSLVWWCNVGNDFAVGNRHQIGAMAPLMKPEWELYTNVFGRLLFGWDSPEATTYGELARASSTPRVRRAASDAITRALKSSFAGSTFAGDAAGAAGSGGGGPASWASFATSSAALTGPAPSPPSSSRKSRLIFPPSPFCSVMAQGL